MGTLFLLEIILLALFIFLGLRFIGKVLGLILAFVAWLIVGAVLFGIFIYPDYKNFKDPTVKVYIDKIDEKTMNFLLKQAGINIDNINIPQIPGLQLTNDLKQKLIEEYLNKEYLHKTITVRNGTSPGVVIVDLSFIVNHPELLQDNVSNFEKLKIILCGYKTGHVRTEPELKNKDLVLILANFLAKCDNQNNNAQLNYLQIKTPIKGTITKV
jgi:energy-coupling factor transporter transmembrane protein EcfT